MIRMRMGMHTYGREMAMFRRGLRSIAAVALAACVSGPALGNTGTVEEVLSGDVVRIGDSFIARLTGIKVPPRNEIMGFRIYDFTKREIEGKRVKLFTWTTDNTAAGIVYDSDGHAFVQIYYGKGMETSFNELLLKKGYARVDEDRLPEDLRHYLELEKEAREKGLGIWADKK
jgi:endonuclease YncB( thermonuclease family)